MNPLRVAMMVAISAGIAGPAFAITDGSTVQGSRYVTGGITIETRSERTAGRYTIDAEFKRQSMTKAVTVARNARGELYFRFDTDGESLPGAVDE